MFCAGLLAPLSLIAADETQDKANPFQHIVERNVFALKPPPPPPTGEPPPPPPTPLAKVVLTGILNVLGPPRALLEVTETEPGKPAAGQTAGQPKKPILREGERDGSIEVLSIDVEKNVVRIKNGSVETNLTFAEAKQGGGPPPGATPQPPSVPGYNAAAAAAPGATGAPDNNSGRGVIVAGANPSTPANPPPLGSATGLQLPQRQIRSSQVVQGQNANVDPVAQWVQMKAEEERLRQQTGSRAKVPPPPPIPGAQPPQ